jgi:hypothetical protein
MPVIFGRRELIAALGSAARLIAKRVAAAAPSWSGEHVADRLRLPPPAASRSDTASIQRRSDSSQ